jgi:hypothetical protein
MSTVGSVVAAPPAAQHPVLSLAGLEIRRLLRHPVFVVAVLAYAWYVADATVLDPEPDLRALSESWTVCTAAFLGLGGFVAMHRITRSTTPAREIVRSAPIDEPGRTLALCATCLVPFALAVVAGLFTWATWELGAGPQPEAAYSELTRGEIWAFHVTAVLTALGGPLLGVAVARWWRWPMAGGVVAVALVAWCVSSNVFTRGFGTTLHHMAAPFTLAMTGESSVETFRQAGSWYARVPFVVALCALAALAALLHGSTGHTRRLLLRALAATAALALVCLLVSTLTGPEGVSLWHA